MGRRLRTRSQPVFPPTDHDMTRWVGWSGHVAHPDAPLGGGGPGRFARSGPLGTDAHSAELPHPQSPSGHHMLAPDAERMVAAATTQPMVTGRVTLNITVKTPKVSTFRVGGRTLADVKQALDQRKEWGLYDATQNFRSSAQVDGTGKIVSVTMELNPVISLPVWSGYSSATKPQQATWDAMYHALQAHENHHHQIQVDCVETLKKELEAATPLDADRLNRLIEKLRTSAQDKQDAYDRSSGHGAAEGVVLKLDA